MIGDTSSVSCNGDDGQLEIRKYHSDERGGIRAGDANISRVAGVVAVKETNSRELASFRGVEKLARTHGR